LVYSSKKSFKISLDLGVQGSPCRGLGYHPQDLFFLAAVGGIYIKEEKFFGGTPNPGMGLAAPCIPHL
jgi:hypothetical protein